MRKSLLKSLVATAVVGTTMALTSVAAFAATSELNFQDTDKFPAKGTVASGTDLSIDGLGIKVVQDLDIKDDNGDQVVYKEGDEVLYTRCVATTGDVNGIRYTKENATTGKTSTSASYRRAFEFTPEKDGVITVYQNLGAKTTKKHFTYSFPNETVEYDSNDNLIDYKEVDVDYTTYAEGSKTEATFYKATANVEAGKTYTYGGVGTNANLYAVVFEYEDSEEETFLAGTVNEKAAIANVDGIYYAFAPISKAAAEDATTLTVAGVEAEAVYTTVSLEGLDKTSAADFGGDYVYGVKLVFAETKTLAEIQDAVEIELK